MFSNELELERYLRDIIAATITVRFPHIYTLENKKAVDILICRDGDHPALFFLEVKLFQKHHGRLGIGSAKGRGFQPEIVRCKPSYFETHLRWVIADSSKETPMLLFLPTSILTQYMAGGAIEQKFNNITSSIFQQQPFLDTEAFQKALLSWLTEPSQGTTPVKCS